MRMEIKTHHGRQVGTLVGGGHQRSQVGFPGHGVGGAPVLQVLGDGTWRHEVGGGAAEAVSCETISHVILEERLLS